MIQRTILVKYVCSKTLLLLLIIYFICTPKCLRTSLEYDFSHNFVQSNTDMYVVLEVRGSTPRAGKLETGYCPLGYRAYWIAQKDCC